MELPKNLPPAPSTAPRPEQPLPELAQSQFANFDQIKQNYINMLQANNEAETTVETSAHSSLELHEQDVQNILDLLLNQTSPSMTTPATPGLSTSPAFTDIDDLDTPLIAEDDFLTEVLDSEPLFAPMPEYGQTSPSIDYSLAQYAMPTEKAVLSPLEQALYAFTPESPMLHDFGTMSMVVNPASLVRSPALSVGPSSFPSPAMPSSPAMAPPMNRRKSSATGTRKGLKPEALVPIDAPTQPRKYVTPSATSRKDLPATFARKRARSTAFGDEDEEHLEPPGPNATELEQIEYKRRQNTIAARRSRARKLQHQQELEDKIERLTQERDAWKERASMCQQMLLAHGIPAPTFED